MVAAFVGKRLYVVGVLFGLEIFQIGGVANPEIRENKPAPYVFTAFRQIALLIMFGGQLLNCLYSCFGAVIHNSRFNLLMRLRSRPRPCHGKADHIARMLVLI